MIKTTARPQSRPLIQTINIVSAEALGQDMLSVTTTFASAAWTANLLVYVPFILAAPLIVSQFFWRNGSAVAGSVDVGIYTENGSLKLGSSGATGASGTGVIQVVDVTDFYVPSNTRLWLALGCDDAGQAFGARTLAVAGLDYLGVKQQAAGWSSGLPTTATFAAPSVAIVPLYGFTGGAVI